MIQAINHTNVLTIKPTKLSKNLVKKAAPLATATGTLAALMGAYPSSDIYHPPGVNVYHPKDLLDGDGFFETLMDKISHTEKIAIEDTPIEAPINDFVTDVHSFYENFSEGLSSYGEAIVEAVSECL